MSRHGIGLIPGIAIEQMSGAARPSHDVAHDDCLVGHDSKLSPGDHGEHKIWVLLMTTTQLRMEECWKGGDGVRSCDAVGHARVRVHTLEQNDFTGGERERRRAIDGLRELRPRHTTCTTAIGRQHC